MKDPKNGLSKARSALVRLKRIWRSKTILRRKKLYKTLVVPVLLYGCETWKVNKGDDRAVDVFDNKCLRRILQIQWQDHASTEELLLRKSRCETYEKRSEAEQMEDDWTYTKTGAKQPLQHSNDLGTRRKKKKSKTKKHLEANG